MERKKEKKEKETRKATAYKELKELRLYRWTNVQRGRIFEIIAYQEKYCYIFSDIFLEKIK